MTSSAIQMAEMLQVRCRNLDNLFHAPFKKESVDGKWKCIKDEQGKIIKKDGKDWILYIRVTAYQKANSKAQIPKKTITNPTHYTLGEGEDQINITTAKCLTVGALEKLYKRRQITGYIQF
jgi:hypothetical protein